MTADKQFHERILILAPVARDGPAMGSFLIEHGFAARVCGSMADLRSSMAEGAGALL